MKLPTYSVHDIAESVDRSVRQVQWIARRYSLGAMRGNRLEFGEADMLQFRLLVRPEERRGRWARTVKAPSKPWSP